MNPETWNAVDSYISARLLHEDPVLDQVLRHCESAGLPAISVAPNQGRLLQLLAEMQCARRILEIGTLGGYSTICLARALPEGGKLVTLELDPRHAGIARENFQKTGLSQRIELRIGPANDALRQMVAKPEDPYDLIFIDADKASCADYFSWALALSRPGTLIIVDNVIRGGAVADPASSDVNVQGVRRFYDTVAAEPRVAATAIQTVGSKGYDGFALCRVR